MFVRIVKMVFQADKIDEFLELMMHKNTPRIRAFDGCEYLQVFRDKNDPNIVFTYSHWINEAALENYRQSDLFKEMWAGAKSRFAEKAQAWSVDQIIEMK